MATFTVLLKDALELTGGSWRIGDDGIAVVEGGQIGLEHFPIFDEEYRPRLKGLIFDHFMNREIGMESINMFAQQMRSTLNIEMPYFNQWYKSTQIEFDPMRTVDMRTVSVATGNQKSESTGNSSSTATAESDSASKQLQYPQTRIVNGSEYATSGGEAESVSETQNDAMESGVSETDTESDTDTHMTGYQGIPADMLVSYRQSLVNVDRAVIEVLEPLFMGILNNGDSLFPRRGIY